jgi:hypothetical protein
MKLKATKLALKEIIIKEVLGPKNINTIKILIKIILVYSAMKIKANPPLLYSILKPDTSSDSPSAKSNGVRLVSASLDTYHIATNGNEINMKGNDI